MDSINNFGYRTNALDVVQGLDLSGKTVLITGGTSGLGLEASKAFASAGAQVVMTARSTGKGDSAKAEIAKAGISTKNLDIIELDLSNYASVKSAASAFLAKYKVLDILVNNAGVMAQPLARNKEGHESHLASNHLGHFLFTGLIIDALKRAKSPRVVVYSSVAHAYSPILFNDVNFEKSNYDQRIAYGQSKTANALFAVELNRRYKEFGLEAFSLHPGGILTGLQKNMSKEYMEKLGWVDANGTPNPNFKTPAQGAATAVWAATSPSLKGKGGCYLEDCNIAKPAVSGDFTFGVHPHAQNADDARRLWDISELMVGFKY